MAESSAPRPDLAGIEVIADNNEVLAYVIRTAATTESTSFFTSDATTFQAGFVVYPKGGRVYAHAHLPVVRRVVGTSELLMVRSGACAIDIYSDDRRLIASRDLHAGDAVLSVAGGHGFRMTDDTVLLEVKQGPYAGVAEKERFETDSEGHPL